MLRKIIYICLLIFLWMFSGSYVMLYPENDEEFLARYGWTIANKLNEQQMTLPESFENLPGEFPIEIYWAYNNELSKAIGLDMEPYLGKNVTAVLYKLNEGLPEFLYPSKNSRSVIIKNGKNIIGAWICKGRHNGFACTLDRRSLADIGAPELHVPNETLHQSWKEWLLEKGIVNPDNDLEKKLAKMSPVQIIETYYNAIDEKDYKLAYACRTRRNLVNFIFTNMDNSQFFNNSFSEAYDDGIENIESVEITRIKPFTAEDSISPDFTISPGTVIYTVSYNIQYKRDLTSYSGLGGRIIVLVKEIESLGWRMLEFNTGM
ncbi:DUF4830 domain-containing protein [candidate division KSB1 bacterium]